LIAILLIAVPLVETAAAATIHAAISRRSGATSFVLGDDGKLWCWGSNDFGQYGDGTTDSRLSGRPAPLPAGVTEWRWFAPGLRYFAIDQDGRLFAWGEPEILNEINLSSAPNSRALLPVRLGSRAWKKAVPPVVTAELGLAPFGLGIDESGALWWLRAPQPLLASALAFSEYREDPAGLPADAGPVVDVVGGGRCFVALTQSGRVFVAGQESLGLMGPRSGLTGTSFSTGFLEVDPPVGASAWTRIAVVSNQVFAWTDRDEIYVWGNVFDVEKGVTEAPMREPRFVPGAPSGLPVRQLVGLGYHTVGYLFVDENGEVSGCGPGNTVWPFPGTLVPDLFRAKTRLRLEPQLRPVQALSVTPQFQLILGPDGLVRAKGRNEDGQLGQITSIAPGDPGPLVIPGGEAPFLLGTPAVLPRLRLTVENELMLEPTTPRLTNGVPARLLLKREGTDVVPFSQVLRVAAFLTNGLPSPDTNFWRLFVNRGAVEFAGLDASETSRSLPLDASYVEADSTPLWLEFSLAPSRWYEADGEQPVRVRYQPTVPENLSPAIRVVWPPAGVQVYCSRLMEYFVEVEDPDGYVAELSIQHEFTSFDPVHVFEVFPPAAPGTPRRYRVAFTGPIDAAYPTIQASDDRGRRTIRRGSNETRLGFRPYQRSALALKVRGVTIPFKVPPTTGPLVLESSFNLRDWTIEQTYQVPNPGLPSEPVTPSGDGAALRFYRLRNPDAPLNFPN
jgi:hypothetical protein